MKDIVSFLKEVRDMAGEDKGRRPQKSKTIRVRRRWERDPTTQIIPSKKPYNRDNEKRKLKQAMEGNGNEC